MKKILFLLVCALSLAGYAQDDATVVPPTTFSRSGNVKIGVLADKTLFDSARVIYAHSIYLWIKNVEGEKLPTFHASPIVIEKEGKVVYGFSITGTLNKPVSIKDGAKVLLKTDDDKVYNAQVMYGCNSDQHTSSNTGVNPMNGQIISAASSRSSVSAHIVMDETQYVELKEKAISKIRIETTASQIDFEIKGDKLHRNMSGNYPILKEAISKASTGFDNNF